MPRKKQIKSTRVLDPAVWDQVVDSPEGAKHEASAKHVAKLGDFHAMRATAAELREDNQQNLDEGGNVEPASAVLAPEIGNPANEQVCPPELLTWAPYAGIAHFPDGMIREDNHTIDGAGSQFSEEISDSDYVPSEARSVLLSELDSDNEANGEGWEMNPGDLRAMVEAVMPSVQGTRPQLPPTQKHRQTDKSWWPFRSKEAILILLYLEACTITSS
ncbi:hypothetical protein PtA15_4A483 [Puccinia triticina]|uniref:Uncharacterized protein n=1 Tax=Puccinia triticina TaxID=208348 RepID=A0ABY7CJA2_9BASI|nr:uncharacterized protein PtA15_4A483 [Puccinia triticina]WAQ84032.1 hypothetical protein PtA15_4A483 [Puccinia triticina]